MYFTHFTEMSIFIDSYVGYTHYLEEINKKLYEQYHTGQSVPALFNL